MIYKVGLTGLIGSGKSQAANYFAQLGIDVIDTDLISHQITAPDGIALPAIIKDFGKSYVCPDGSLNRPKMRELIFKNDSARINLELILHPLIFNEVLQSIAMAHGVYTVIVVPLLFKSPRYLELINRSVFVDCKLETLIKRVMERNAFSAAAVEEILKVQLPRNVQLNMADDILDNNKNPIELKRQVEDLDKKYKDLFK